MEFLGIFIFTNDGFLYKVAWLYYMFFMMKVILNKSIPGVGRRGDLLSVKDGYYRNFLFPRDLAMIATPGRVKEVEGRKQKRTESLAKVKENAKEIASKLQKISLELTAKTSSKSTLYAAIGPHDLVEALREQAGVILDASHVIMPEHIKKTGNHAVKVKLSDDVEVDVNVNVKGSKK